MNKSSLAFLKINVKSFQESYDLLMTLSLTTLRENSTRTGTWMNYSKRISQDLAKTLNLNDDALEGGEGNDSETVEVG